MVLLLAVLKYGSRILLSNGRSRILPESPVADQSLRSGDQQIDKTHLHSADTGTFQFLKFDDS